jgi:hypothetical protein
MSNPETHRPGWVCPTCGAPNRWGETFCEGTDERHPIVFLSALYKAAQERVTVLEEYFAASETYHYDLDATEAEERAAWERLDRARKALASKAQPEITQP